MNVYNITTALDRWLGLNPAAYLGARRMLPGACGPLTLPGFHASVWLPDVPMVLAVPTGIFCATHTLFERAFIPMPTR